MDQNDLVKYSGLNEPNKEFSFDEVGMTWQVSFVRYVSAPICVFKSIEDFFICLIKYGNNMTTSYIGKPEWIETVNLIDWVEHLKIEKIPCEKFVDELDDAFRELDEEEHNWEESERIDRTIVKTPNDKILQCWKVEETDFLRNPVGATWSFIAQSNTDFFYLERHWES